MSREIYHAGFLTKSPPKKKLIKASWRRRYFTLKQGELPGQFFLEYYTDETLRKFKGRIDLDECEQVDAGLRLDRQKRKYQHMFDIKTSHRIYYLAADTEDDMRGWVTCICQVCGLQELAKNNEASAPSSPAYITSHPSTGAILYNQSPSLQNTLTRVHNGTGTSVPIPGTSVINNKTYYNYSNLTETTTLQDDSILNDSSSNKNNSKNTYQNSNNNNITNSDDSRESDNVFSNIHNQLKHQNEQYINMAAIGLAAQPRATTVERTQSFDNRNKAQVKENGQLNNNLGEHTRTQSFNGAIGRRIPENLKLNQTVQNDVDVSEPSPALSTSSGPYIPISECFSGSPIIFSEDPKTPLNSLDPRFYDTPRSHINIGLNLTNDQYSPKRNNVPINNSPPQQPPPQLTMQRSASPTDSDNVFPSDDDEWSHPVPAQDTLDRSTRPSDSSIDNDQVDWQFVQRFSKKQERAAPLGLYNNGPLPARPPKKALMLEHDIIKETTSSDTENPSPVIGPQDLSCSVDESIYDLPRSHQKYPVSYRDSDTVSMSSHDMTATSTPNFPQSGNNRQAKHNYTNAAPMLAGGNVFRYDFDDQEPPSVNRKLKPKISTLERSKARDTSLFQNQMPGQIVPPNVNRNKKPLPMQNLPPNHNMSVPQRNTVAPSISSDPQTDIYGLIVDDINSLKIAPGAMHTQSKHTMEADRLQYLDLDHSTSPKKSSTPAIKKKTINESKAPSRSVQSLHTSTLNTNAVLSGPGTQYTTVDFLKTHAFKAIRDDSEKRLQDGSH